MVEPFPTPPKAPGYPTAPSDVRVLHVAGWGRRVLAYLIDILLITVVNVLVVLPLAAGIPEGLAWLVTGFTGFLYFWLLTAFADGRTLGKMATRLETVTELGGPPTVGQAALDAAGKAYLLIPDLLIGLFVGRERRQRLTQKMTGLAVVVRDEAVESQGSVRFSKT
ncbi:MAG TPA: RDD family protein [Candidatus Thermoplasmatota archaeon]|nr:RDD family protein [Candidatus Thermoplasmatota archaeon]